MGLDAATADAAIDVIDPSNGELITQIPDGGPAAIDAAVARARETFDAGTWHGKPGSERARILWRFADLLEEQSVELGATDALDTGMRPAHASKLIVTAAEAVRYYAGWINKVAGQSIDLTTGGGFSGQFGQYHAFSIKEPIGVAGLITPWNGPMYCAVMKLGPALAAGCSAVLKPAELAPLFTPALERILSQAGVPEGVVTVVNGYGRTAGAALAAHPDVDKIAFTGSTETGRQIACAATGNLKKVTLELGGKSPVLVFADADLDRAAQCAAMGIFMNSGQGCICGSRVYVQRSVAEAFIEKLVAAASKLRVGGSREDDVDMGPLISERQAERVMAFIDEGRAAGVEVRAGGRRIDRSGFYVQPTVLTNVAADMRLMREEIFGPVVAVTVFDDEDEAVACANDSDFGLAAAVWTSNLGRGHRLAKRIKSGTVWLNCQMVLDPAMPFGGFKQSGWGRERSVEGVEIYMQTKSIYADLAS